MRGVWGLDAGGAAGASGRWTGTALRARVPAHNNGYLPVTTARGRESIRRTAGGGREGGRGVGKGAGGQSHLCGGRGLVHNVGPLQTPLHVQLHHVVVHLVRKLVVAHKAHAEPAQGWQGQGRPG